MSVCPSAVSRSRHPLPPTHPITSCLLDSAPTSIPFPQEWSTFLKKLPDYINALLAGLEHPARPAQGPGGSGGKPLVLTKVGGAGGAGAGGSSMHRTGSAVQPKAAVKTAVGGSTEKAAADTTPPSAGKGGQDGAAATFTNPLTGAGGSGAKPAGEERKAQLPLHPSSGEWRVPMDGRRGAAG